MGARRTNKGGKVGYQHKCVATILYVAVCDHVEDGAQVRLHIFGWVLHQHISHTQPLPLPASIVTFGKLLHTK